MRISQVIQALEVLADAYSDTNLDLKKVYAAVTSENGRIVVAETKNGHAYAVKVDRDFAVQKILSAYSLRVDDEEEF